MNTAVAIVLLVGLSITNAYVIIGPKTYIGSPYKAYIQPYQSLSRAYLPAPVTPVQRVSTVVNQIRADVKAVDSDETVIAGPSGVIKTQKVASRPVPVTHTETTNIVHPQPISYLAPPLVGLQQPLPLNPYYRTVQYPQQQYLVQQY